MPLFSKRNKQIGEALKKKAEKVFRKQTEGSQESLKKGKQAVWSDQEIANYFVKVGLDHKGDLQSYLYEKGSSKGGSVSIDVIALAAACGGAPAPEVGLFADVGARMSLESTRGNLVLAYVMPSKVDVGGRQLRVSKTICFLAAAGKHRKCDIAPTIEVGIKTPDIPGIPQPTGGDWNSDENKVNPGTYAELVAFECSAKASVSAEAGGQGEWLYLCDPVPSLIARDGGEGASAMGELKGLLLSVLEHGDKKQILKERVLACFDGDPKLREVKPEPSWWKRNISGGNVSTDKLIAALLLASSKCGNDPVSKGKVEALMAELKDYNDEALLEPYSFLSLWSVSPYLKAGTQASATLSASANVGVASAGATADVTLTGPSLDSRGKFSYYRFQVAALADPEETGRWRAARPGDASRPPPLPDRVLVTQDTRIVYGQIDINLAGASVNLDAKAAQGIFSDENQQSRKARSKADGRHGEAEAHALASWGLEETSFDVGASAAWRYHALNYMHYRAATAVWSPPTEAGAKKDSRRVALAKGSGYALGHSVDVTQIRGALRRSRARNKVDGYLQGLGNSIGATGEQMADFIDSLGDLIDILSDKKLGDPNAIPSAFLIEATFRAPGAPEVECRWVKGRWMLGPFGTGKTLRNVVMPKKPSDTHLEAIWLRYRLADTKEDSRTRFNLGIKYIGGLDFKFESVERAGSEGIVTIAKRWYNDFDRFNELTDESAAFESAVPPAALLHQ